MESHGLEGPAAARGKPIRRFPGLRAIGLGPLATPSLGLLTRLSTLFVDLGPERPTVASGS